MVNFVINDMEVYLVKFFLLNIHKAKAPDKPQRH